ncbi:MAG: glycosyltransferase family 4 protein [Candidatus Woesearchaeota archaeon]
MDSNIAHTDTNTSVSDARVPDNILSTDINSRSMNLGSTNSQSLDVPRHPRVLMFGWEFPPFFSGGLGTACYGLTKGLAQNNIHVTFVMPQGPPDLKAEFVDLIVASNLKSQKSIDSVNFRPVDSILTPYLSETAYTTEYERHFQKLSEHTLSGKLYGKNIYEEVYRFSRIAGIIAGEESFDIIHCHDWMTFPAGIQAKRKSGKPLIVQIHATEFDRSGNIGGINQYVYDIERTGMHAADHIIAVSQFTKNILTTYYDIPEDKVTVIHNAVDFFDSEECAKPVTITHAEKIVLFLGRITLQKGPDYFIEAAKKVLDFDPHVTFIVAGSGDMEAKIIQRVAELGIGRKVLFAGFLTGRDVDLAYKMADLYVMPSVSEPFGITPLEALRNGTPVIISKQSGVSEVLKNALKVDFWDVDELANKIISVLNYRALHHELQLHGLLEVKTFTWNTPAQKCIALYRDVITASHTRIHASLPLVEVKTAW